jgi:peptide/nickel transport system substrate-binding protein
MRPQTKSTGIDPRRIFIAVCALALLGTACSPAAPNQPEAPPSEAKPAGPKILRMAALTEPRDGIALGTNPGSTGGLDAAFLFHSGLTAFDEQGNPIPRIATKVPSLQDGDWKTLPNGGMEVTWKLRPGILWHDGAPLTADDLVLGYRILNDEEIPLRHPNWLRLIGDVKATDPETLVVSWKQAYIQANSSGPTDFSPVPVHILGALYESGDKQAVTNSPYWTQEFVGVGPYRLTAWSLGSSIQADANDAFFLGRPNIDRIITQYIPDVNAVLTALLAGEVDVVPAGVFKTEQVLAARNQWETRGEGMVAQLNNGVRIYWVQLKDPAAPWADARVRQALVHMLDRQSVVDTLEHGLTSVADTLPAKDSPAYQLAIERGLPRYAYDLNQAERLLSERAWTRGADGAFQSGGQKLVMDVRGLVTSPENLREILALADMWKTAGITIGSTDTVTDTASSAAKDDLRNTTRGVFLTSAADVPDSLSAYLTSQIPAEGKSGSNRGAYSNPDFDRLYGQFIGTLDADSRRDVYANLLKVTAEDLPFIPVYYYAGTASIAVRKGVQGPGQLHPQQPDSMWNVHEWKLGL